MPNAIDTTDPFAQRLESALKRTRPQQPPEVEVVTDAPPAAVEPTSIGAGPIGDGNHVVRSGQCTSSIAKESGHFWETIWTDPANTTLREVRKDPNVLLPGDRVYVLPIRPKTEYGATLMRHRFVRRGEPSLFRLRVLDDERNPRGNEDFVLTIDALEIRGTTDPDGVLQVGVPGDARRGVLHIGTDSFELNLHGLDPAESVSGVQARLKNLGFYNGSVNGLLGADTADAIRRYQRERNLTDSGQLNGDTCETLRKEHRS